MKRAEFKSLIDLNDYFRNEEKCIQYFIKKRWNGHITCPHKRCQKYMLDNNKIYILKSKHDFKCACCGRIFSYKTGTIFENSKVPMKKWFMAIYLQSAHKKGISSVQLAKDIRVKQQTAWFMLQRLKEAEKNNFFKGKFKGTSEADECYVGGLEQNKHTNKKGQDDKACVFGMINRDTKQAKVYHVSSNEKDVLLGKINVNIDNSTAARESSCRATIITDTLQAYTDLSKWYNHKTVKHCAGEYNRNEKDKDGRTAFKVNTNSIEGFWSIVKRTIIGTHHWISKKHLQRYLSDIQFRYNTKAFKDTDRFDYFLGNTQGRLKYCVLVGR